MPLALTSAHIAAITNALSPARLSTYAAPAALVAAPVVPGATGPSASDRYPLELYRWNSEISGAFLTPLDICSVVLRNAIAEAIEGKYGARWPWSNGFVRTLPNPSRGYSARQDLLSLQNKFTSTGKIIPELKLVFWSQMLTARHDQRLWTPLLFQVFPNFPAGPTVAQARNTLYTKMEQLRLFRNRIAHHEPIFKSPLAQNLTTITELVAVRCSHTVLWLNDIETVTPLIGRKP
jgi:hypothetical protein